MTSRTSAPHSVLSVVDESLRTTLLTPSSGPTLVLEEDLSHGNDRVGVIDVDPIAGVRLGARTYLLDDRGISAVTPFVATDPDASLDVEDFVEYPEPFFVEGATRDPGGRRLLAIGFDAKGALAQLTYDGARLSIDTLPFPPGMNPIDGDGRGDAQRAGILATGSGELVVAVRDDDQLFLGAVDGFGVAYRAAIPLREPVGPPHLVAKGTEVRCYQAEGPGRQARRIRGFSWSHDASSPTELELGDNVLSLGLLVGSNPDLPPFAALSRNGHFAAIRLPLGPPDDRDESVEFAQVAWNAQEPKFFTPLALHFTLFALLSLLGRRRPNPEPRIIVYRPAPLLRRAAAAIVDMVVLMGACWLVFQIANDPAEIAYFGAHTGGIESEADVDAMLTRIKQDPIFASIFADYIFLVMFLLTMIHAVSDALFGRTLGKRLLGLRVMSLDGEFPNVGAVATRSLLMLVDYIIYAGLVGVAFILFSKRRQRLGDLFSGTVVVEAKSVTVRKPTLPQV